ncbi:hypothetical protein AAT19DRAFT_12998 [Rhodotorula toruloides]|uniref:Uncharacterized protein n=1 Tax=Rhodotorula toruloides TaxID=5286 RepID=A0A2T0AD88_RHOTO|nr:hypothetical protein AAT19DRAFT_12998 [Rhodotorula toruloides]
MVNKQYRSLLGSPAYQSLWQESRKRLDLPDVTSGGLTEFQYAHLMFGKRCQSCKSPHAKRADFGIRLRLCKACRNLKIVRLDLKSETLKHLHPMTKDCALAALHSQNNVRWFARAPYGLLADVEHFSNKLWELEYEDEAEKDSAALLASSFGFDSHFSSRRGVKQVSYAEVDSEDDAKSNKEDKFVSRSERVRAFVAQRQVACQQLLKDAKAMSLAEDGLRNKLRERNRSRYIGENFEKSLDRSIQIESRIEELDEDVNEDLFLDYDWFSSKLIFQTKPLTDEEWELIKDDVFSLLQRIRRKQVRESTDKARQNRQEALRPRYDKLKQTFNKKAQLFLPLFVDFLLFESVRPLWESSDVKVTAKLWTTKLDSIKEELEQYRLDLLMHARQVILEATMDPDDPQTPAELDKPVEEADLSNAFFARATSFVCCSFTNCSRSLKWDEAKKLNPRPDETNSIGPLVDVLRHLHISHNFDNSVQTAKALKKGPQFHIKLPLEVACAVSAILEVGDLDETTAGQKELHDLEHDVRTYGWEWENSTCAQRKYWSWFRLLYKIKVESDKAARNKPPLALEPPCIVLRQWHFDLPPPGNDSDEEHAPRSTGRFRRVVSDSEEDEDEDEDEKESG